jgi:two-component system NtrC family sensor kinase
VSRTFTGLGSQLATTLGLVVALSTSSQAAISWLLWKSAELDQAGDLTRERIRLAETYLREQPEPPHVGLIPPELREAGVWELIPAGPPPIGTELFSPIEIQFLGPLWGQRTVTGNTLLVHPTTTQRLQLSTELRSPWTWGTPAFLILAYSLLLGVLISWTGNTWLTTRVLRPIQTLRHSTERISSGHFGELTQVNAAPELADLCGALNTMSASLAGYRERTAEQVEGLRRAKGELELAHQALLRSERLASLGRLAAGIAHEIGNPLAAVLGYMELLSSGLQDPSLEAEILQASRRELERIHRIIRDLLGFARPGPPEMVPLDLHALVETTVAGLHHLPAFRGINLKLDLSQGLPSVAADPGRLQQVLLNLLLNARDAMGGQGTIHLHSRAASAPTPTCTLQVRDDGPGFSTAILEKAGEPFLTTKPVGQGTGLGLAISIQILESLGGRLSLANAPGGGALVEITLPQWASAHA